MDYVVGSVAALISGNVTPNRPKVVRRAFTPTKHQASPNVTPKSEFVDDRSIFLSPTQQKKKAIVKKSPKRIFQNPDLDVTDDCEANSSIASPKAEKVKKHLKEELDADDMGVKKVPISISPSNKLDQSSDKVSSKKKFNNVGNYLVADSTPKKKKKRGNSESNVAESNSIGVNNDADPVFPNITKSNYNSSKKNSHITDNNIEIGDTEVSHTNSLNTQESSVSNENSTPESIGTTQPSNHDDKKDKKSKKKNKKSQNLETSPSIENNINMESAVKTKNPNKKKKSRKIKSKQAQQKSIAEDVTPQEINKMDTDNQSESDSEEVKSRNIPNPNAITEKDSDSEHDSDDEIDSENEQDNEKILTNDNKPEESSDEEEQETSKKKSNKQQEEKEVVMSKEEIKRTLFVGNVPFSIKCKKDIKKVFSKYGQIDTIRIRTIPVKDARVTPKLAIIKNELHPDRTTVNVYVKFADPVSVGNALAENNTVMNGNHLRVSRSDSTGAEHDPRSAVFVGNLPFALEDETLRTKFEGCGEIVSVRIIRDKKTNAGKGFGYVNFASKDGVELALALSEEDLTIKNRILRVKRCMQQKRGGKPGEGGGKWGNSTPTERKWGNQAQRGGKWSSQGRGGENRGNQGQGGGKWGGQGQGGGKWGSQGQGGGKWGSQGQGGGKWGNQGQGKEEGAARRLMNKRKPQEGASDAPANKRPKNLDQPSKEKKPRKEFVGITAEKKKKHKVDKGMKKKQALSEILTKKS